jgi:transcriptional regulator with XRE-family HTH domain
MLNNVSKSNIAKNIKKLRQEKGISQDQLSKLADLSLNTIVNTEAGNNPNPTIETLEKIAKVSDIQNKAIKKDQENFVLVDDEQKPTYSLSEVLDKVIIGDCLKVMKKLPAESFDCVFVDPPYFLQLPPKKLLR